jgi:hypothetical protein
MVKIAFWDNCLCERGTTIALYDYAFFNRTILGNESIILYNPNNSYNNAEVIEKFKKEFSILSMTVAAFLKGKLSRFLDKLLMNLILSTRG